MQLTLLQKQALFWGQVNLLLHAWRGGPGHALLIGAPGWTRACWAGQDAGLGCL